MTVARRLAAIRAVDFIGHSGVVGEDDAVTARWFANIARR